MASKDDSKTVSMNDIYDAMDKWSIEHIDQFFTLLAASAIVCSIAVIERIIARGVYLGNKKTLDYIRKIKY